MRFYEINPDVIKLASQTRWFTYLRDSKAKIDFEPVVKHFDMKAIVVETLKKKHYNSRWVLITRNNVFWADPNIESYSVLEKPKDIKLWTDEYNSLWNVLK